MKKIFTVTALFLTALLASCGAKNVDPSSTSSDTSSTSSQTTSSQTTSSKTSSSSQSSAVKVTGIEMNSKTAFIEEGATYNLLATLSPIDATNKKVIWSSSDKTIATVSSARSSGESYVVAAVVRGIKTGTATITVTTEDGGFAVSCQVTVSSVVHVTGISFLSQTATVTEGSSRTIYASISPYNATNDNITWTSSDESVATVAKGDKSLLYYEGVVNAIKPGKATIKATTEDGGFTALCVVTVTEIVHVKGVSLNYDSLKIEEGSQKQLIEHLDPTWPDNDNVSWSSSDESVAIVSNSGLVTAVSEGEATITVTTEDGGFTAECKVTVMPEVVATYKLGDTSLDIVQNTYSKYYRISTPITNTGNVNLYVKSFSYGIESLDGTPLDSISEYSVDVYPDIIEPGETVLASVFYSYSHDYSANELVAKPNAVIQNAMEYDARRLTVSNVSLTMDQYSGPKVTGKVKNTLREDINKYYVTAQITDSNNRFVLTSFTIDLNGLTAGEERVFSFTSLHGSTVRNLDINALKVEVIAYEYQFIYIH